ncbi:Protoglobin-domain-containing protein [Calycina marina]|uniref:Protoglobin-domain-containing protein n=1 Tax=Calycina marina TaxID=1763456 RepID=A0A9P7Z7W3_9HELO|nr:Protoglobin-domain-containing protein [Calycina marina]
MQYIKSASLEHLPSRISYLSTFLDLTPGDTEALLAAKPLIAPLIPNILDAVYTKLLNFDITAQAFVPKNTGFEGVVAEKVEDLNLVNYLVRLVSTKDLGPESSFWLYMNNVGIMHTGKPGFKHREKKPELRVEFIHMGALLGYVIDLVIGAVMEMDALDLQTKSRVLRAFNKVLWIQNDLFARHYLKDSEDGEGVTLPSEHAENRRVLWNNF